MEWGGGQADSARVGTGLPPPPPSDKTAWPWCERRVEARGGFQVFSQRHVPVSAFQCNPFSRRLDPPAGARRSSLSLPCVRVGGSSAVPCCFLSSAVPCCFLSSAVSCYFLSSAVSLVFSVFGCVIGIFSRGFFGGVTVIFCCRLCHWYFLSSAVSLVFSVFGGVIGIFCLRRCHWYFLSLAVSLVFSVFGGVIGIFCLWAVSLVFLVGGSLVVSLLFSAS